MGTSFLHGRELIGCGMKLAFLMGSRSVSSGEVIFYHAEFLFHKAISKNLNALPYINVLLYEKMMPLMKWQLNYVE